MAMDVTGNLRSVMEMHLWFSPMRLKGVILHFGGNDYVNERGKGDGGKKRQDYKAKR
jgi:hypothetical protein